MTYTRGQETFVYEEIVERVRDGLLVAMHWDGSTLPEGQLPWGATSPLTFVEAPPDNFLSGGKTEPVAANTVALSEGTLPDDDELEIGGVLVQGIHTIFVDIYGEDRGIAKRIALDTRALLTGRVQGYPRIFPMRDWSTAGKPILPGHQLSLEDVEVGYPAVGTVGKLHWTVVKMTVLHDHNGGY